MAAFASCRRSGWVRVLVVILCALFIFATIATPPAYAVGESVALFGAAAVLSAAVAALGFKLSNDADGIATLNKMVSDFAKEAWALNLLIVGNRINGLIDGMNYIKMAVHNGKTYLDERVVAWCQHWLGNNGVYESVSVSQPDVNFSYVQSLRNKAVKDYWTGSPTVSLDAAAASLGVSLSGISSSAYDNWNNNPGYIVKNPSSFNTADACTIHLANLSKQTNISRFSVWSLRGYGAITISYADFQYQRYYNSSTGLYTWTNGSLYTNEIFSDLDDSVSIIFNFAVTDVTSNDTGLSGTDTIGADYKDKTLDQILDGLKTWAQDWYDAGADSATNTATGALDLPVTVGDQAATANPALNPDVVYNPPFSIPWPGVRSGETSSGAISDGKANADAAETATTDVAENQSVIDSLVNWALNYINPDTGLFSKFPLCVPYDAYLLVTSSLGVDAVGSDSIFGASPGDLNGVVSQGIETYSDFQPIINIKHDFELDGVTYPFELTIDLTPWQPLVTFFREGMALLLVAELIGAEFKRIRGH